MATRKRKVKIEQQGIEPLNIEKVNQALAAWSAENDGTPSYPSFGEVLATQLGVKAYSIDPARALKLYGDHAMNCAAHMDNWSAVFTTDFLKGLVAQPKCTCGLDDAIAALRA